MRILLAMLGARLHYLTPRTFAEAGMLESFHTDLCATKGTGRLVSALVPPGRGPRGLKRLLGRVPRGIPPGRIVTHEAIGWRYALRRTRPMTAREAADLHLSVGKEFCGQVVAQGFGEADTVFVYNTASLEISREAKRRGLRVIQEQTIAPKVTEVAILAEEFRRFPDIQHARQDDGAWRETMERELEELHLADIVLGGSEFVKRSCAEHGCDPARFRVLPNTCDLPPMRGNPRAGRAKTPLRVLFAGEVGLRKGAHHLIEALRMLEGEGVVARLAGTVAFTKEFAGRVPANVELLGPVPRTEMRAQFQWADVFCLPSLCEGSPIAISEALASGLPVVTTPHADSLVVDGYNGRVVPIRDAAAIAGAIRSLAEPDVRQEMGLRTSREFPPRYSFEAYSRNLLAAIRE